MYNKLFVPLQHSVEMVYFWIFFWYTFTLSFTVMIEIIDFLDLPTPSRVFVYLVNEKPFSSHHDEVFRQVEQGMGRKIVCISRTIEYMAVAYRKMLFDVLLHQSWFPHAFGTTDDQKPWIPVDVLHEITDILHRYSWKISIMTFKQTLHIVFLLILTNTFLYECVNCDKHIVTKYVNRYKHFLAAKIRIIIETNK